VIVLEAIQRGAEFLAGKGVDSPRLQTELLLAHVLKLRRMDLYLRFDRNLTDLEVGEVRELMKRRGKREPLQHIVGSTSFCGLEIHVNSSALVPRQETELLAEKGWHFLLQRAKGTGEAPSALDLGTGTGCIAISLAKNCPTLQVLAVDISQAALELAQKNADLHDLATRIQFRQADAFAAPDLNSTFDLIISNPPYIPSAEIETLQAEVRDFDPRQALDGGADGLDFYRRLATHAISWLRPGGKLMLEFGDGQADRISEILRQQNWIVESVIEDYAQKARLLVASRE
jgi:release factor glutamine methyltransferase